YSPPYSVLLSQLGRFRYDEKYGGKPGPNPAVTATPTATPGPRRIAQNVLGRAAANNRYIFWIGNDRSTYPVYGYDYDQGTTFLVTDRPGFKFSLAADDRTLVWGEGDTEGISSIRAYDI